MTKSSTIPISSKWTGKDQPPTASWADLHHRWRVVVTDELPPADLLPPPKPESAAPARPSTGPKGVDLRSTVDAPEEDTIPELPQPEEGKYLQPTPGNYGFLATKLPSLMPTGLAPRPFCLLWF